MQSWLWWLWPNQQSNDNRMSSLQPEGHVHLADQRAASAVLHQVLADAIAGFPAAFSDVELPPEAGVFRNSYAELLPRFEAARAASPSRVDIARRAVNTMQDQLVWQDEQGSRPLRQALLDRAAPLPLRVHEFAGEPGWQPSLLYRGQRWNADHLAEFGATLVSRGMATPSAGDALAWVSGHLLSGGAVRLKGRKIAVLGGGAEMAPTRFWLEAGADVLWLDVVAPPENWLEDPALAGRLYWAADNVDLLARPQEILATLTAFADGDPIDLGLYAYAPGQARELLLAGTMNALVDALPNELLASVTLLVSPTTATVLGPEDLALTEIRLAQRPVWEAALSHLGLLGRGSGSVRKGACAASRSIVAIQGASYQAAQYLGKVLVAECWADSGGSQSDSSTALRVSANTAAITRTRSLNHPVFSAAFGGAAAFGVETMAPRLSRRLNGLLALRDWLHPELPTPGNVRVHGGIHTLPYPLDPALRVAAAFGFARSPQLLRGLVKK